MVQLDVEKTISELTLGEKVALTAGKPRYHRLFHIDLSMHFIYCDGIISIITPALALILIRVTRD